MKCPNVITTVDLMTDLLCEIDDIEKLSQTFILLQQMFATEAQKKIAEVAMAFHGKWTVARLQRLQRQLAAMPIADAKPTAGRSALLLKRRSTRFLSMWRRSCLLFCRMAMAKCPLQKHAINPSDCF